MTALISFLLVTIIFCLYYFTSAFELLFVGYAFIAFTGIVNLGILIALWIKASKDKENRSKLIKTSGLMLINIPVLLGYCGIAIILLGTMRITFTNDTGTELTDLNVIGCGGGYIDKLEIGESETVWIAITGNCSIPVDYLLNGQRKIKTVAGYISSSMGQKTNRKIDGQDKDIFL